MERTSLTYVAIKNSAYGFFSFGWPILFSIFITPIVVGKLGVQEFGIFVLLNSVSVVLGMLDLGLGTALVKFVSQYYAVKDFISINKMLGSARTLLFIVGLGGLIVFIALGYFSSLFFHVSQQSLPHITLVFTFAGLVFLFNALNTVYVCVPESLQRYDITTKLNMTQLTLGSLGMLALVLFDFRLKAIFAYNAFLAFIFFILYSQAARKLLPEVKFTFARHWDYIKKAYKFGVLSFLNNLSANALYQLDRFFISAVLGPSQLSYYSLPGNVAQKISGFTNSFTMMFFPMTSALSIVGEIERLRTAYTRMIKILCINGIGLAVTIAIFSRHILLFWLGQEFAEKGGEILVILAFTHVIAAIYVMLMYFLMGIGQMKFLTKWSAGLAALNFLLLLLLLRPFGLVGAAYAYLLSILPVFVMLWWVERKFLQLKNRLEFYALLAGKLGITSLIFFILAKLWLLPLITSFISLLVVGPIAVMLFYICYYLLGFLDTEDKEVIVNFANAVVKKFLAGRQS